MTGAASALAQQLVETGLRSEPVPARLLEPQGNVKGLQLKGTNVIFSPVFKVTNAFLHVKYLFVVSLYFLHCSECC